MPYDPAENLTREATVGAQWDKSHDQGLLQAATRESEQGSRWDQVRAEKRGGFLAEVNAWSLLTITKQGPWDALAKSKRWSVLEELTSWLGRPRQQT